MRYVVGVGARRGVTFAEVDGLVRGVLREAGIGLGEVAGLATVAAKAEETGILRTAEAQGWELLIFRADTLAAVRGAQAGRAALAAVGTGSVAEAAALAGAERLGAPPRGAGRAGPAAAGPPGTAAVLVVAKTRAARATVAVARVREETG